MHHVPFYFPFISLAIITATHLVHAETATADPRVSPTSNAASIKGDTKVISQAPQSKLNIKSPFNAFTGKVLGNKVRMRLQPNLDGMILREFQSNDLVVVVGESEDFYAIQPPKDTKAYIFRTFVLDGIIEGNRVNVRLEPDLSAPVIAQMNTGDRINGAISEQDKKWMEIGLPASVHFYVAKEYVEKIGDASVFATLTNERSSPKDLEAVTPKISESKHSVTNKTNTLVIAEPNTNVSTSVPTELASEGLQLNATDIAATATHDFNTEASSLLNSKMASWLPIEKSIYENWMQQNSQAASMEFYYQQQLQEAVTLRGIIEPYNRSVRNKPGDFILVNQANHLPIAYLYSTQVNLQDKVGYETSVQVIPRDNHHFAFPAYFVLAED